MILYREMRRRFTRMIGPVISACLVGYFSYHIIQGNHGLRSYWKLGEELNQAQTRLSQLKERHQQLEHKVSLLRPDSTCADLLDEQVRKTLGYSHPQELVILHSKP